MPRNTYIALYRECTVVGRVVRQPVREVRKVDKSPKVSTGKDARVAVYAGHEVCTQHHNEKRSDKISTRNYAY